MQEISLNQITKFSSIDSFSYTANNQNTSYATPKKGLFSAKSYLAVKKSGEVVVCFQNIFQHFFDLFVHRIFTVLKVSHETSDLSTVWQALKASKLIQPTAQMPPGSSNAKVRDELSKIIGAHLSHSFPSYNPASDIAVHDFQKYAYYLEQDENDRAKAFLDTVKDLNGYFLSSKHTPLTLALQKENFELLEYILTSRAVDPNKPTLDGRSPLEIAIRKDLPRKYFMALFQAGACPKDEREVKKLIDLAGERVKLIQAIKDVSAGKPINWPAPQFDPPS